MKYIVKIIVSAFALISAAACYNNEIDNPDNPQNPEQSGLRITATMAKTRVNYGNETDAQLLPEWEEGDILFGFYGDDPDDNGIVLMVSGVNEGVAELEIVSGELANQNVETSVCLIYTGCNEEDLSGEIDPDEFKFSEGGTFTVDLTSQNLDHIPVCMSATATIGGNDAAKTLSFNFAYDCAVLEIQSLRGFKEDKKSATSISKIEVTDLVLGGKYTYDTDDGLNFEPNTATETYSVEDLAKWGVNVNGELVYEENPKGFLIAAAPNSTPKEIQVKVYNENSGNAYFTHFCKPTTINSGRCYVVRSEEVVAKTIDGLYFTTVKAAFDRAAEIADELKIDPTLYNGNNIVTLVKDEIEGLGAPASGWWNDGDSSNGEYNVDLMIDIDYNVTLDLNYCNLLLCCTEDENEDMIPYNDRRFSGGFYVKPGANFSITDNSVDKSGHISSGSSSPIIINEGTVEVDNGYLYNFSDVCTIQNCSSGHFLISDGEIYSQENNALDNYGIAVIEGGEVDSYNGRAVYSCGELTINGGDVHTQDYTAIIVDDNDSDNDIEVNFTMNQGAVYATYSGGVDNINGYYFSLPAIRLIGNVTGKISGGTIEGADIALEVLFGADCTISGGIVRSTDGMGPAVLCYTNIDDGNTRLTVEWPDDYDKDTTEPLISTSETNDIFLVPEHNFTPICAYSSQGSDYANVVIKGGYLFSYESSFFCSTPECLVYSESENFFTNTPFICTKGDSGTAFSLYDDPDDSEDQKINSTCLMASIDNERVILNPFDKNVSYLPFPYKIVKKPANAAEGNTDIYTFTPYGW